LVLFLGSTHPLLVWARLGNDWRLGWNMILQQCSLEECPW
jgi:hypothetical protein